MIMNWNNINGIRRDVVFLSCLAFFMIVSDLLLNERNLSINLGNGNCQWTGSAILTRDDEIYGTLLASYPASGMRVTWQQIQGLTGVNVRDDFFMFTLPKIGTVKTQYPHYEGIWSYSDDLKQVILLVRNPRWAIPSYHTLINELNYAHTWEYAYDEIPNVFTRRAPMEDWVRWRDYVFNWEIRLWGEHIDFYMYNGTQYWFDYDLERNGQYPFRFRNETERPWPQDMNCKYNMQDGCVPKAIVFYENIRDEVRGPIELKKIAKVFRGKVGYEDTLEDEAIECIWHESWIHEPNNNNDDRDAGGLPREAYNFTMPQYYAIEDKLVEYIDKYNDTERWGGNALAQELVSMFVEYLEELRIEIATREANPVPTSAPYEGYYYDIQMWYNSKGLGDRNTKARLQNPLTKLEMWDQVKHLYDDGESHIFDLDMINQDTTTTPPTTSPPE